MFSCEESGKTSVEGVSLDEESMVLFVGESVTLGVTLLPEDVSVALTWSSDNELVAVVDDGVVTAVSEGKASIAVQTDEGGYSDVCEVQVYTPASSMKLDCTDTVIEVGESTQLTVVLEGGNTQPVFWSSSDDAIVTVNDEGLVTSVASGEAVITASVNNGALTADCEIISGLGIISFRTDKTWEIGSQIWSDAVMASRAEKDDFYGGTEGNTEYVVDCRQNRDQNGEYGDWFSWMAVVLYASELCPDGWRVPTTEDFIALDKALGGDGTSHMMDSDPTCYINEWGGEYGGYVWYYEEQIQFSEVGTYAAYWSQTEASETLAYSLNFGGHYGFRTPGAQSAKYNGFTLRCVKDK